MEGWEQLPVELLSHIYTFLSRRDRLACSLVCDSWKDGLNRFKLWKTFIVYLDFDLKEPSTVLLVRDYGHYIKHLEVGWSMEYGAKWSPEEFKDLTKRIVRFLLILYENFVQITRFRIFNWFDFLSFHKVVYHLTRFLKMQIHLNNLIFDNTNIISTNCTKVLSACLCAKSTITSLDIRGCYYLLDRNNFLLFRTCVEQLSSLKTFKLDYFVLSCRVIDSILISGNTNLENLEIILKDKLRRKNPIDDLQWCLLCSLCPKLKVTLIVRNIFLYSDLKKYLKRSIPMVALSMVLPKQGAASNFRKILNLIVNFYHNTLESLELYLRNDSHIIIDDLIMKILRRCTKLESFLFSGCLQAPARLQEVLDGLLFYCVMPDEEQHLVCCRIGEDVDRLVQKRVRLTMRKDDGSVRSSLMILN